MLLIDKSNTLTRFIVTISEVNIVTSGSTIELFNRGTNVTTNFDLPIDSSLYPDRYNEFVFDTSTFSGLFEGVYAYTIRDEANEVTETGLLKVVDELLTTQQQVEKNYVFIAQDETDDDFIVYQPK